MVDMDGTCPVKFALMEGDYLYRCSAQEQLGPRDISSTRHSTLTALNLGLMDLSTPTFETDTLTSNTDKFVLWSGNCKLDIAIKYARAINDRHPILSKVGSSSSQSCRIRLFK